MTWGRGREQRGQALTFRAAVSRGDRAWGDWHSRLEDYKRNIVRTLCACTRRSASQKDLCLR